MKKKVTNTSGVTAIYVRRSVADRDNNSLSIESQKEDCISRNLRDYLNVSEELDKVGVSVYSLSEPFNTETKEWRMMRNDLLNFAEFERETGFYQGGIMNFGYAPQRMTVNSKTGSVLVPSDRQEH